MVENPYDYIRHVSGDMFYNRQELDEIIRGLRSVEGDSFAVISGRRMGKTSLLREIERRLLDQMDSERAFPIMPVYVDLNHRVPRTKRDFFKSVIEAASEVLEEKLEISSHTVRSSKLFDSESTTSEIDDFEDAVTGILGAATSLARIVILIDEFDQVVHESWSPDLYSQLRAITTNRPISRNLAVVLAGSHKLDTAITEKGSPLRNVLKRSVPLTVFSEEDCRKLIVEPLAQISKPQMLDESLIKEIYIQTGGHPFLVQYIMWNLCDLGLETASRDDIIHIIQKFITERDDFDDWVRKFGIIASTVYALLVKADEPLSRSDLAKYIRDSSALGGALRLLLTTGVIRQRDYMYYEVCGEMFKMWFKQNYLRQYEDLLSLRAEDISTIVRQLSSLS